MDFVEQFELRVAAVHHVAVIGSQLCSQDVPLSVRAAVFAASHFDRRRHAAFDVKVRVQSPGRLALAADIFQIGRLGDGRKRLHHAAVNGRQHLIDMPRAQAPPRSDFRGQLADDLAQPLGIEHVGRLGQRAQRGPAATQLALDVVELGGLLQGPQRPHAGIEHEQQHQPAILVHEELPIARLVALTADIAQAFKDRHQLAKILEALNIPLIDRLPGIAHAC
jgi:hypothetical protein